MERSLGEILNRQIGLRKSFGSYIGFHGRIFENDNVICEMNDDDIKVYIAKSPGVDLSQLTSHNRQLIISVYDSSEVLLPQTDMRLIYCSDDGEFSSVREYAKGYIGTSDIWINSRGRIELTARNGKARLDVSRVDGELGVCCVTWVWDKVSFKGVYLNHRKRIEREGAIYFKGDKYITFGSKESGLRHGGTYMLVVSDELKGKAREVFGDAYIDGKSISAFEGTLSRWVNKHEQ